MQQQKFTGQTCFVLTTRCGIPMQKDVRTPSTILCMISKQPFICSENCPSTYPLPIFICISKFFQRHQLRKLLTIIFCLFPTTEATLSFIFSKRNGNNHLECCHHIFKSGSLMIYFLQDYLIFCGFCAVSHTWSWSCVSPVDRFRVVNKMVQLQKKINPSIYQHFLHKVLEDT